MSTQKVENKSSLKRKKTEDSLNEKIMSVKRSKKGKINEKSNEINSIVEDSDSDDKSSNDESSSEEAGAKDSDSEDSNSSEKNSSDDNSSEEVDLEDKNSVEENHFKNLFKETFDILEKTIPTERDLINKALRDIKESFKTYNFNSMDFDLNEYLFAYFKCYSPLNAAVSRHRFLNAINNCGNLKTYVNKSKLNVISLGGGAGTDMVGFCSAFQECREEPISLLNLCVVDKWKRWESFNDIIKMLLREKKYGNASMVFQNSNIYTSFMTVDLMAVDSYPQKYKSAVKCADIVLLARVLDSLKFSEARPEDMLRNITERMKKDALLLLVDSNVKNYNYGCLKEIYCQDLEKFILKDTRFYQGACESNAQIAVFVKMD